MKRVVVTGATGNVGTSVLEALAADPEIDTIVGIARRRPAIALPKVQWREGDVTATPLAPAFEGADAVVHLAWLIQPSRDREATRTANVSGSQRVFEAAATAGVPALIYASSVGAYSAGPKDRPVDESWPTEGVETAFYSRDKAAVERLLDGFEGEHPELRVVRLRPGLIFKAEAATEIRRLFLGPFAPRPIFDPRLIPLVPRLRDLRFQAVHSHDVGEAYRLAVARPVAGAFNIAADPVLDSERLAAILDARQAAVPERALRAAAAATWRLRLQPTPPGWLDMALSVPLMDTRRAREELGWRPRHGADEALLELLAGMREGRGLATPPLDPRTSGPLRVHELRTGVGARAF
jgi:UDP-glucose 4-epimerase